MHLFPDQCLAVLTGSLRKSRSRDECLSDISDQLHLVYVLRLAYSDPGNSGAPWGILTMSVPPYCGTKIYRMVAMLSVYASARFSGCEFSSTGEDNRSFRACVLSLARPETGDAGRSRNCHVTPTISPRHPSDHLQRAFNNHHRSPIFMFALLSDIIPYPCPRPYGHGRQAFDSPSLSVGC